MFNNQVLKYVGKHQDKTLFIVPNILFTKILHYMMSNDVANEDICASMIQHKGKMYHIIGGIPSACIKTKMPLLKGERYMVSFTIIKNQLYIC